MKKIKNKKIEFVLATIIEVLEFVCMSLIGHFAFKISVDNILIVLLTFFICRFAIGSPGHYKIVTYFDGGWRRCVLWTSSLIISLFLVTKLSVAVSMLFTVFTVFIISGKANIEDIQLGFKPKNAPSKYADIEEYVKFNEYNEKLINYESKLKSQDNQLYLLYKYRFKDGLTFQMISERLDIDKNRITEKLDAIALSIRILKDI